MGERAKFLVCVILYLKMKLSSLILQILGIINSEVHNIELYSNII